MICSVVLSKLEYYCGTVFLTTNLLEHIDDAFRSRTHIHLCYPPLSTMVRTQIWKSLIARARNASLKGPNNDPESPYSEVIDGAIEIELSSGDYDALSDWHLNGREIKNVIHTACMWCSSKQESLTRARLETLIQVAAPFAERESIASPDSAVVPHSTSGKAPRLSTT